MLVMTLYTSWVQAAANFILYFMWTIFLDSFLDKRFTTFKTWCIWLPAYPVMMLLCAVFPIGTIWRSLLAPIVYLAVCFTVYSSKPTRIFFGAASALMIMTLCELVIIMIFPNAICPPYYLIKLSAEKQIGMYIVYLSLNAIALWLGALLLGRYRSSLSTKEWLLYTVFPCSQVVLVAAWYGSIINGENSTTFPTQLAALLVCVAADLGMYYAVRGMAQRAELRTENAMLEKQIDSQKEHYSALTEQYENIRRMRHDIDNHLYTMQILLQNGQTAEAEAYISELQPGSGYKSSLGRCENPVADAFLFSRVNELKKQGIEVDADVVLPHDVGVTSADLVCAFGNLLDNAAEACTMADDKCIKLRAFAKGGYILIDTVNPVPHGKREKTRRIPDMERGVGFHILSELSEKYDGEFTSCVRDGRFYVSLTLKEMAVDAENSSM
jgi:hypothetical protein